MRRKLTIVATTTAVLMIAAVAFASWTASGTGNGSASARSASGLTAVSATSAATLYPGGSTSITVSISNPNPYPVHVHSVVGNGDITSDPTTCNVAAAVTLNGPFDVSALTGNTVPAKVGTADGTTTITIANALSMDNDANDLCQGAAFTVPLKVTGESVAAPHA